MSSPTTHDKSYSEGEYGYCGESRNLGEKMGHPRVGDIATWGVDLEGSRDNCMCTKVQSNEGSITGLVKSADA